MNWLKLRPYQKTIIILSGIYAGLFLFMLIARPGSKEFYHAFFNIYQAIPPLFASICAFWYFAKGKHASKSGRVGWFLIGMGCLSFFGGQTTWTVIETFMGQEVPYP